MYNEKVRVQLDNMGSSSNADILPRYGISYICKNMQNLKEIFIITNDTQILHLYEESTRNGIEVKTDCFCEFYTKEDFEAILKDHENDFEIFSPIISESYICYRICKTELDEDVMIFYSYFGKSLDASGKLIDPLSQYYFDIYRNEDLPVAWEFVKLNMNLLYSVKSTNHTIEGFVPKYEPRYCVLTTDIVDFRDIAAVASPSTRASSILFITVNPIEDYYINRNIDLLRHIYSYDFSTDGSIFDETKDAVKFLRKCRKCCPKNHFRIGRILINARGIMIIV